MNEFNYASIALLLAAVFLYYWRVRTYNKAAVRAKFPTVTGSVVSSVVREEVHEDNDKETGYSRSVRYVPVIRYSYSVGGSPYENDRYAVLDQPGSSNSSIAQAIVDRYPKGTAVTVHYNPDSPGDSFLDNKMDARKVDWITWFMIGILVVLALVFSFIE
jgi:hypothetical protein